MRREEAETSPGFGAVHREWIEKLEAAAKNSLSMSPASDVAPEKPAP